MVSSASSRGRRPRPGSPSWRRAIAGALSRALLGICIALGGVSCTLLPFGGWPTSRPGGEASPTHPGFIESRISFHCHSFLSHDCEAPIEDIARAAKSIGIDVVCLNDHYAPGNSARAPRGEIDGVLFIPGVELRAPDRASILAVGVTDELDPNAAYPERVEALVAQGAFLVAGHVEALADAIDLSAYGGFEIYNLHAEFKSTSVFRGVLRFLFLFADPFFEWSISRPELQLARWDRELAAGRRLTPLAGHDAHANVRLFGPLGGTIGTYAEIFRLFSTRVLVRERSEAGVLEALRAGRVFVVFDYLADTTGFAVSVLLPAADRVLVVGESGRFEEASVLRILLPEPATLRVLRDGEEWLRTDGRSFELELPGPGIYRVEVLADDQLWILAAPIYLE